MPYISRDINGCITGVFECSQYDGQEFSEVDGALWQHPNNSILKQITALEKDMQTPRRIREAFTPTGAAWLADLDAQIATLRGLLK
jgi:hypothetical protein